MKRLALSLAANAALVTTQSVSCGCCRWLLYEEKISKELTEKLKSKKSKILQ